MEIRVDVTYRCGCAFSTRDVDKAVAHCKGTKHSLTVHGNITAIEEKKPVKSTRATAESVKEEAVSVENIERLRSKLRAK